MFDFEEYYKLYNDKVEGKYRELKAFLENFATEAKGGKEKGFRERMMTFSRQQATFLLELTRIEEKYTADYMKTASIRALEEDQKILFGDLFQDTYVNSLSNPSYMISLGGKDVGPVLSSFAHIFKEGIMDAFMHRRFRLLRKIELYFELHKRLLHGQVRADQLQQMATDFRLEQSFLGMELEFHQKFDPNGQYYTDLVLTEDLSDCSYLYAMGLPVTQTAIFFHDLFGQMPKEEIDRIASRLVDKLLEGTKTKDRSREQLEASRTLVAVSTPLGLEVLARRILEMLQSRGLTGFISEIQPCGFSDKYVRDHRYDMVRGLTDEQVQDLAKRYHDLLQDNQALVMGSLGQIRVSIVDPQFRERSVRGKREQALKALYESLIEANELSLSEIRQGAYPILELAIPVYLEAEKESYRQSLDLWLDHQFSHELQAERANEVLLNAFGGGETVSILGRSDNRTDLVVGLKKRPGKETVPYVELLRHAGALPCGQLRLYTDPQKISGTLYVGSAFYQGRNYDDLEIVFEEGAVREVHFAGEETKDAPVHERWQSLQIRKVVLGLNMALLEAVSGEETPAALPEQIMRNSCLTFDLGPELTAAVSYGSVRLISAVRPDGSQTDVMREGLFMPIGSDAMNLPLMRIYQNKR